MCGATQDEHRNTIGYTYGESDPESLFHEAIVKVSESVSVFLATPCFGGLVNQAYMQSVISLMQHAANYPMTMTLAMLGNDALITRSRNTLVSTFLNDSNATHLLFIDADISFEAADVIRLLMADKDVVAGMYPIKALDWESAQTLRSPLNRETEEEMALQYVGSPLTGAEAEWDGDFVTASYAGTGLILIKRQVIETMIAAYPHLQYGAIHAYPRTKPTPGTQYALFECMIDTKTGLYLSEDYAFCHRWREIGGQIWLDTRARLTHTGPYAFPGNPDRRYEHIRPARVTA